MTDNVVPFRSSDGPEDLVLVCPCGGTTFFIRSDRALICAACDDEMEDDVTGVEWERVQKVDKEPRTVSQYDTIDLAFNRVLSLASVDHTAAMIVMNKDGKTNVWTEGWEGDPATKAWFQRRVDDLMEQLR